MDGNDQDLKTLVDSLTNEYVDLRLIWQEFTTLFSCGDEQIKLFNDVAPSFFHTIQRLMIEALVIRMSRITDRKESGNSQNLTLSRIPDMLPKDNHDFVLELNQLIDSVKRSADTVRQWRNQGIAHSDYNRSMSMDREVFKVAYVDIRDCVDTIHTVLNRTSIYMWDTELSVDVTLLGGASSLLSVLQRAHDDTTRDDFR